MSIGQIDPATANLQPNKVLSLILITLSTLMGVLAGKLVIRLVFPNVSPWGNEVITIISGCLAINIAAYLILYKYQLLMNYVADSVEVKTASLIHANNNLKLEIAERQEARFFLENVLDNCPDPISIVDEHGKITRWNKAAESCYGYNFNELRKKSFPGLYADQNELDIMLSQLRQDGFVRRYEINMKKKDGSVAPFEISIRILKDKNKRIIGSVCIARDRSDISEKISKLKTLNEQLLQKLSDLKQAEEK